MKVAILGTGAMGSRMARRLLDTGQYDVTVWNRTAERTRPLTEGGAHLVDSPAQAGRDGDVVLSMVRDDEAARAVWLEPASGALSTMPPGAVAIDCSTVTPNWSRELAARGAERDVAVLDAPLAGSRPQAESGGLIFFVGGDQAALDRVRPLLLTLGGVVHHVGPAGAGTQVKLAVNALFAVQVATVAELLATLAGTDVSPARALEVIASTPVAAPAIAAAAEAMLRRAYEPSFPIDLVVKDLGYAAADGATRGRDLPVVRSAQDIYRQAARAGHGGDDITGVLQHYLTPRIR
jgi:3-hydroxyisobutyrate dehydrogenase